MVDFGCWIGLAQRIGHSAAGEAAEVFGRDAGSKKVYCVGYKVIGGPAYEGKGAEAACGL